MSSGGRSRGAAIALLAGLATAVVAAALFPAALYWSKTGTEIHDARTRILRADQREQTATKVEGTRASWTEFVNSERSGLILEDSTDTAIAATKRRIEAAFADLGGRASRVEVNPVQGPREGVQLVSVEASGIFPRKNLGDFLGNLESRPPFVIVDAFNASVASGNAVKVTISGSLYRLTGGGS